MQTNSLDAFATRGIPHHHGAQPPTLVALHRSREGRLPHRDGLLLPLPRRLAPPAPALRNHSFPELRHSEQDVALLQVECQDGGRTSHVVQQKDFLSYQSEVSLRLF